jgi:hypothetical protein
LKINHKYIALTISAILLLIIIAKKVSSVAALVWEKSSDFFTTSNSVNLQALARKVGITLSRNTGLNNSGFSQSKYQAAKTNPDIYWAIYDINKDTLIESSSNADENVYGASVPKVFVASAALANNKGNISSNDYEKIIKLLVKSDNDVWTPLQNLAGGGQKVNDWAKGMGYNNQPARSMGNNANAIDMCKLYRDVWRNNFIGAEVIYRISSSCQTSTSRSRKYMPTSVYIGSKTGTYLQSNHDCGWVQNGQNFYAIAVFTELGSGGSDFIATMWRGLYNEYIK